MAKTKCTSWISDAGEILKLPRGFEVTFQGHIIGIREATTQIPPIFDQGIEPPMDRLQHVSAPHGAETTARSRRFRRQGHVEKICIRTTTSTADGAFQRGPRGSGESVAHLRQDAASRTWR